MYNYKDLYLICDCTYDYMFLNVYVERFHVVNKVNNMVNKNMQIQAAHVNFLTPLSLPVGPQRSSGAVVVGPHPLSN